MGKLSVVEAAVVLLAGEEGCGSAALSSGLLILYFEGGFGGACEGGASLRVDSAMEVGAVLVVVGGGVGESMLLL